MGDLIKSTTMTPKLFKRDGFWGISNNGGEDFVPPVYVIPLGAVNEWKHFETDNTKNKQFLPWIKSLELIDEQFNALVKEHNIHVYDVSAPIEVEHGCCGCGINGCNF